EVFADTFARFFGLRAVVDADEGHGHTHDDLIDTGELQRMTWSTDPAADVLGDTVSVVAKYERDVQRSREALPRLVDPNATVPASLDHDHGHSHSHGSHTHGGHRHDHDHEDDGRRVRAAKDAPGRHDDSFGARGGPADAPAAPREVRSGQGARSFAANRGSARRRPV
ncbi:MAG TPA: hypothetical protein VF661_13520, partial [Actinomycetales bacterium]